MKTYTAKRQNKNLLFICVTCLIGLLHFFSSAYAQEKHAVQIRTFDQAMAPYPNLEVSVNNSEYIRTNNKGIAFTEFTDREIPVKNIRIKNDQLEAASWNYVRGTLEIMVRKKNYKLTTVTIRDEHQVPLSNLSITFYGKTTTTAISDAKGQIQIPLGVNDIISSATQFSINGYTMKTISDSPDGKVLTVSLPAKIAEAPINTEASDFDFSMLDTVQSLPVFYKVITNQNLSKLSKADRHRMDSKFNELFGWLQVNKVNELKLQRIALLERISDSTFLTNDIKNIVEQARLENKMLGSQRGEFDQIVALINKKLDTGISNLSAEGRQELLNELTLLEDLLIEYESLFFKNQSDYRVLIKDIKNHFSEFEDLEEKLTISERTRMEQERLYRQRFLMTSSLIIVFALLIILLIYFTIVSRKQKRELQKANNEIKQMNENLELMISRRTKLLQSANHELDTFLYRASHDLRTPVRSIIGLCQLSEKLEPSEKEEIINRVSSTSKNMDQLLMKLSDISEINQPPDYFTPVKLIDVIEKIRINFLQVITEKKIECVVHTEKDLEFHSNPHLIESILFNLLENALYFSTLRNHTSPLVEVTTEIKDKKLNITVRDNGIGINESMRKKLFEMFFKGSELSNGNGLGLYIVQKAVNHLNGKITLESVADQFTQFTVILPPKFSDNTSKTHLK